MFSRFGSAALWHFSFGDSVSLPAGEAGSKLQRDVVILKHPPCTALLPFQLATRPQTLICATVTLPSSLAFDCVEPCILFSPKYICVPALTSKSAGQGSLLTAVLGGKRTEKYQMNAKVPAGLWVLQKG